QNDEEGLVENRFPIALYVLASDQEVPDAIDGELHVQRIPFDGESVKAVRRSIGWQHLLVGEGSLTGVSGSVDRGDADRGCAPAIVHDVQLAALRPWNGWVTTAQHPERGPQPLTGGQLDARFYSTRREDFFLSRRNLRRRVATG